MQNTKYRAVMARAEIRNRGPKSRYTSLIRRGRPLILQRSGACERGIYPLVRAPDRPGILGVLRARDHYACSVLRHRFLAGFARVRA